MTVNEMIEAKARYAQLNSILGVCTALVCLAVLAVLYGALVYFSRKEYGSYLKAIRETRAFGWLIAVGATVVGVAALGEGWNYFTAYEKARADWAGYQILEMRFQSCEPNK